MKNEQMKGTTSRHRTIAVAVVVVPPRLRAVVAPNLVSQTRGSLAFLGLGVVLSVWVNSAG